jgi:hypothetical protein
VPVAPWDASPQYGAIKGAQQMFYGNVIVAGGPAPTRAYIDELLPDVMEGRIDPGRVFDRNHRSRRRAGRLSRNE